MLIFFSRKLLSNCCALISEIVTHWKKSRCIFDVFEGKKHSVFTVTAFLLYHYLQSVGGVPFLI